MEPETRMRENHTHFSGSAQVRVAGYCMAIWVSTVRNETRIGQMAQETTQILAAPRGKKRGTKSKKIANSLVALSSAAIVSVYGVGYFRTQSAADALTTNIA